MYPATVSWNSGEGEKNWNKLGCHFWEIYVQMFVYFCLSVQRLSSRQGMDDISAESNPEYFGLTESTRVDAR